MKHSYSIYIAIILASLISACGGGGGGGGGSPVIPTPVITSQPISATVYETQTATFDVTATDSGIITYQWLKNGSNINGSTLSSYTTSVTTMADNGASIAVAVTGSGGTTTSSAVILTVQSASPSIVTAPSSQSIVAGQTANFSVTAAGLPPYTYQWMKNSASITGATTSNYSTSVTLGDTGSSYSVSVTNSANNVTSNGATLTVQPSTLTNLIISEVSTCYYRNVDCWFEIYNPTNSSININSYTVKSTSVDVNTGATSITIFSLPSVSIASDGYIIISGNNSNAVQRGMQNVRLRTGDIVPFWTGNGFIELLAGGATVDFINIGTSIQSPVTASKWSGPSVSGLLSSASDYGRSIVRPYPRSSDTNTGTASDWISVDWATPAGRNDVPAGALDDDGDGIPDSAETSGGTFAGMDLYAMGARTGSKDIFIEVDSMTSSDPGVIPRSESLQKVVDSFAIKGINIRFDTGNKFSSGFSVSSFNLGQGNNVVAYEPCVTFSQTTCSSNVSTKRSIYDWKEENMDLRRRGIFHYLLIGNSQSANGAAGSSGLAEFVGNDFIVTMGGWGLTINPGAGLNQLINMQASTVMHELGHNLGLNHGGNEATNYKPNYWSIMNYMYQLSGLDPDPTSSTAHQRWRYSKGDGTPILCSLVGSPCGNKDQFIMSYSDGSSSSLNEGALLEASNIGRGSNSGAYADWNMNGSNNINSQSIDINGDSSITLLNDYNDWGNLVFPYYRSFYGNSGRYLIESPSKLLNPVTQDQQEVLPETPPPASFFRDILRR